MIPIHRSIAGLSACGALAILAGCAPSDPFARLDTNHDGSASPAEFESHMKQEVFTRVDANMDGKVMLPEWQTYNPKVDRVRFNKADENRDGAITRSEADTAFDRERSLAKLFAEIDANGDGSLSRAETSAYRDKLRQQAGDTRVQKTSTATSS